VGENHLKMRLLGIAPSFMGYEPIGSLDTSLCAKNKDDKIDKLITLLIKD